MHAAPAEKISLRLPRLEGGASLSLATPSSGPAGRAGENGPLFKQPVRSRNLHLILVPNSLASFWDARPAIPDTSIPVETSRPQTMVRPQGLEPRTNGLRVRCSTS